ncbi:neprilysin-4-like isoform X2 [Paramacrobiotus metropolitanus]|uniref:neprilysin-4-like isoform X2 n=1 Tax=Paramacrobiotus metropolitanus TaxID=2943436 RepID=UPI002445FC09|nr:neprilysin-4-like isoform X2 [Paramacrobiotus metropolitanus]
MFFIGDILGCIQSLAMMLSIVISGLPTVMNTTNEKFEIGTKSPVSVGHGVPTVTAKTTNTNVCESAMCRRAGQDLLSSLDTKVDPCEDFFAYTCNNWIKSHPMPADKASVSLMQEMDDTATEQLRGVLNDTASENIFRSKAVVKDFFKKCVNEESINDDGVSFALKAFTETIGQWPAINPAWKDTTVPIADYLFRLSALYNARHLVQLSVDHSLSNSSQMLIFLGVDSGFEKDIVDGPTLDLYVNGTLDMFSGVVETLLKSTNASTILNRTSLQNDAASVVEWMTFLANISLPAATARNPKQAYANMTVAHFQSRNVTYPITSDTEIYVTNPDAFMALDNRLLKLENDPAARRGLMNFLGWRLLDMYSYTLPFFIRKFFEEYSRKITGMDEQQPRWKDCIGYVSVLFPVPTGALYVDKAVSKEARTSLQKMVKDLKAAMREIIGSTTWMGSKTKEHAIAKLDNIAEFELYSDSFSDPAKLDRDYGQAQSNASLFELARFGKNLNYLTVVRRLDRVPTRLELMETAMATSEVNAFYENSINGIAILAGISQYPYFDAELPEYINYAGMGAVVGHELTHGFDDTGAMFDKDGNLRDWWTAADKAEYDRKATGVVQQYNAYESFGLHVNGNLTQGENIADGGGFKAALLAYRKLERDGVAMKALPGFENVPFEKMFYLAHAYSWCEQYRPEMQKMLILTDPHSPGKYRVNGILNNTPDFARIFNCTNNGERSQADGVW